MIKISKDARFLLDDFGKWVFQKSSMMTMRKKYDGLGKQCEEEQKE